jgi:hypothetical protein
VELMFSTYLGPVLAMAELLSPCSAAPIGLQPFRFIAMDNAELRNLRAAIAASSKTEVESQSAFPWPCSRQPGDVAIPDTVAIVPE